jgi:hypothetical protein
VDADREEHEPYEAAGWRGRIHRLWRDKFGPGDPLELCLRHEHHCVRLRPGGCTWRVQMPLQPLLYVKHVSAQYQTLDEGGWRLGKRLRWAMRHPPALRLLRIASAMKARGVEVPRLVLVAWRGRGPGRQELVVTEAIDGRRAMRAAGSRPQVQQQVMRLVGEKVYAMHEAGILHGHLLPAHMLVTEDLARVIFIDNDENQVRQGPLPWRARLRNLEQLAHQVLPLYAGWRPFFIRYFELAGLPRPRWRLMLARVLHRARRRQRSAMRPPRFRGRPSAQPASSP